MDNFFSRARQAMDLRVGIELGLDQAGDAVAWADRLLADPAVGYDARLAAVSLAGVASPAEMIGLLEPLCAPEDEWPAIRQALGRVYDHVVRNPETALSFAERLEQIWINHHYEVPDDLGDVVGPDDALRMAWDNVYGDKKTETGKFVEALRQGMRPGKSP